MSQAVADHEMRAKDLSKALLLRRATVAKLLWNRANEAVLGIRTTAESQGRGEHAGWWRGDRSDRARHDDNFEYATVDYWNVRKVIRILRPGPEDVFYDIGCGMGRIVCSMARKPVKKCVGIELFEPLCQRARENAARLRGRRSPIEIICEDAACADVSDGTIYWLFNPFGESTLRDTLANVRRSLQEHPRRIRAVYYNSTCEQTFVRAGWLNKTREFRTPGGLPVTFWENEGLRA
jgi:SAM-dependent methyltransferase